MGLASVASPRTTCGQIPEGFEIVTLAVNPNGARYPQINECGQIVYSYYVDEALATDIYLHDNGRTANLSNASGFDVLPDINDFGLVVWSGGAREASRGNIMLYGRGKVREIGPGYDSSLNNAGHILFEVARQATCAFEIELAYYDGLKAYMIYEDDRSNQWPVLNNEEEAIWTNYDFCTNPWESEILGHDDGKILVYPTTGGQAQLASLSDSSLAGWSTLDGVEVYEHDKTYLLAADAATHPAINSLGSVYYVKHDLELGKHQPWVYRGGVHHRLVIDTKRGYSAGDINDHDEIVFSGVAPRRNYEWSIWYMRRIRTGEADFDGDIDLADHREVARCLDGPDFLERNRTDPTDTLCECRFLDLDHDNDVDLRDFAGFQNGFAPR